MIKPAPETRHEEPQKPPVELKFVFMYHELANVDQAVEKFKNADVLLLERVTKSEDDRRKREEEYNLVLKPKHKLQDEEIKKREEAIERLANSNFIWDPVIAKLAGTGKEAHLIDVTAEHETFPDIVKANMGVQYLKSALVKGDIESAYKNHKGFIDICARLNPRREAHVVKQLGEIVPKIPEGKTVIAAQGVVHTPTRFRAEEALGDKANIGMEFGSPDITYSTTLRMIRLKSAFGEKAKIEEEDYRWGFLADSVFWHGMVYGPASHLSFETQVRLAIDLAQSLIVDEVKQINEVEDVYREFPKLYQETKKRLSEEKGGGFISPPDILAETAIELTKKWIEKKGLRIPKKPQTDQ